ncbi:MAG: FAD-dependent oxidoreductase [Chlorobia bacterium]|nr:FAD-dependent oxidoreductase [Fimbriimonadaceae bacterium]
MNTSENSNTESLWLATSDGRRQESNATIDGRFDVAIIGAGIVGISTAYQLRSSGLRVILLEARTALSGVTGHTTGKLTSQHGLTYKRLIDERGFEFAKLYGEANEWAIRFAESEIASLGIECDHAREAAYVWSPTSEGLEEIRAEVEACSSLNMPASFVGPEAIPVPSFGAIKFSDQVRFHPLKFLRALLDAAVLEGVQLAENYRVTSIDEAEDGCTLQTEQGEIKADKIMIATNYPIEDSGWFVAKLAPYRSYASSFVLNSDPPEGMYISSSGPLRSFRKHSSENGDYLIVGSGHHRVGQDSNAQANFEDLEAWARANFDVRELSHRWSTQDNWTPDELPYIGLSPDKTRMFLATGFAGWGMSTGLVAGKIISNLITTGESAWSNIYDPSRSSYGALAEIVKENVQTVGRLVGDRLGSAEVGSLADIPLDSGAIWQAKDRRVAVYRSATGQLQGLSTVCPHVGCQVDWNDAEKSWDCPCHGSRFDLEGNVLHGPAVKALERVDLDSLEGGTAVVATDATRIQSSP